MSKPILPTSGDRSRPPSPIPWQDLEQWLTQSFSLQQRGISFEQKDTQQWLLRQNTQEYRVTFKPEIFDNHTSSRLLTKSDPLLDQLIPQKEV